ncbi:MAG: hypothetical protein AB1898_11875 [Acidobacteriota bacterium]
MKWLSLSFCLMLSVNASYAADCDEKVTGSIRIDPGHPWRPPFGLERIGRPLEAVVEIAAEERPYREYWLEGRREGRELDRQMFHLTGSHLTGKSPYTGRASFPDYPDELVLYARCRFQGEPTEIARVKVDIPGLEAEAAARPEAVVNPTDLGAVLVPADWLLVEGSQKAQVQIAALDRTGVLDRVKVEAWYDSAPLARVAGDFSLRDGKRAEVALWLPAAGGGPDRDVVHVSLTANNRELWHKKIPAMRVNRRPQLPVFGATSLKLRYGAPISVRDPKSGALSSLDYNTGWSPELNDVLVTLPNGSRFVFWRGSSYIPFWAGKHNTGLSYEWAETSPPPDGFVDSVEPLMDKELRYSRVEIVESSSSRVHVRWTYQSTDFTYKVWGDAPTEDFYFYPDGFGTRVLNLRSAPEGDYELSEFILLAPQEAYPFSFMPRKLIDVLELDGQKRILEFPGFESRKPDAEVESAGRIERRPKVYRVRLHKDDPATAVYFNFNDVFLPEELVAFRPFYDRGVMVTPAYWGSHWPLARGNTTGRVIDDRIHLSPSHNSLISWARNRPKPIRTGAFESLDTLGRSKPMVENRWVWMIGMSEASDGDLLDRARTFMHPPSVEVRGAILDHEAYSPERRAIRIKVEKNEVEVVFKPVFPCLNPVLELLNAPKELAEVRLEGRLLATKDYAWDGQTLWLNVRVESVTPLRLKFR